MKVHYQPWTEAQRLYYEYHVNAGRGARLLPLELGGENDFLVQYEMLDSVHRHLNPYRLLRKGDHALMAGVHDGFIELGVSTLFIMAARVGPTGHVWAVEPDARNRAAIEEYANRCGVSNVTLIPKAVWRERTELEFVTFTDFSSSNMSRESFERKEEDQKKLWGRKRRERESTATVVQADTIDNIIREDIGEEVRFVNLTINGAEAEALKGADEFLRKPDMRVAFPLQELESPLYPILEQYGLNTAVGDAPTKAWEGRQFLYGTASHLSEGDLTVLGYVPARLETDPSFPNRFRVLDAGGNELEPTRGNES